MFYRALNSISIRVNPTRLVVFLPAQGTRTMSYVPIKHSFRFYSLSAIDKNSSNEMFVRPSLIINEIPNMNFKISERAAKRLSDIFKETQEVLKVSVESGGCHGFQYHLKLIPYPKFGLNSQESSNQVEEKVVYDLNTNKGVEILDHVLEDEDFEAVTNDNKEIMYVLPDKRSGVILDESSLNILNNTSLMYTTELIGSTFKIVGGNMKSSCGCGSSFDVDFDAQKGS